MVSLYLLPLIYEIKLTPRLDFPRSKSPSFVPSPTLYSDALNASLQSALGLAGPGGRGGSGGPGDHRVGDPPAALHDFLMHHQRERDGLHERYVENPVVNAHVNE